jgi:hypothetical protein
MLTLEIVYTDADLVECVVSARSGAFAAAVSLYFTSGSLLELAQSVAGFPAQRGDHREFKAESLGSAFSLRLDASEAAGRCTATVEIVDDTPQSAVIRFSVYAGDVDSFERAVRLLSESEEGVATLGARATSAV